MNLTSYEKAADENRYLYIMHWDSMRDVHFKFHDTHVHRAIEMVVCEEGKMSFKGENIVGEITSQEILIFNSFDKHYYEYVEDFKGYIIVFSSDFLSDILISPNIEFSNKVKINDEDWDKIKIILEHLFLENEKMTFLEKKANALLFFNCLSSYDLLRTKVNVVLKDIFTQIFEYIEANYSSNITLNSISKRFGYSPNYFSALLSNVLGKDLTFKSYLNFYRVQKVLSLKESQKYHNDSIKNIIGMCGFESPESYYRNLKKYQEYCKNK